METSMMKDITEGKKSWRVGLNPKILILPRIKAKQKISCHIPPSRICSLHSTAPNSGKKLNINVVSTSAGRCTGSLWNRHTLPGLTPGRWEPIQPRRQQKLQPRHEGLAAPRAAGHAGLAPAQEGQEPWHLVVAWAFPWPSGRFPRWEQSAVSTSSAAVYEYFNAHKKYITSTLHSWLCGAARGMWTSYLISVKSCKKHWFRTDLFGSFSRYFLHVLGNSQNNNDKRCLSINFVWWHHFLVPSHLFLLEKRYQD